MDPLTAARLVFEEVRDQPYRLAEHPDDIPCNCMTKNEELLDRLGVLGFPVPGRVVGMDWGGTPLPQNVTAPCPIHIPPTHFYLELQHAGAWHVVDASWDAALATAGFPVAEFLQQAHPAVKPTRILGQEEQCAYFKAWEDPTLIEDYFASSQAFLKAANQWFTNARQGE